jgi:hypothetical protein
MGESLMIILRWGRTVDQKMEAMHGTLCTIPPVTVTNNMNIISYNFMDFPLHGTILHSLDFVKLTIPVVLFI